MIGAMYRIPEGSCAPVMVIKSVSSGLTPTNLGFTPASKSTDDSGGDSGTTPTPNKK
jgi:hypothetical protein